MKLEEIELRTNQLSFGSDYEEKSVWCMLKLNRLGFCRHSMTANGRTLPTLTGSYGSLPAGHAQESSWSNPTQMTSQLECKRVGKSVRLPSEQHLLRPRWSVAAWNTWRAASSSDRAGRCCGPQHSGIDRAGCCGPQQPLTFQMLRHPAPARCNKSPSTGTRINCCRHFAQFAACAHLLSQGTLHHG
jgi:hypothetical protein